MDMKIPTEKTETPETPDFDPAVEHVLRKNQELYKRLAHRSDLGEVEQAFSEVRRQYRHTLQKLSE